MTVLGRRVRTRRALLLAILYTVVGAVPLFLFSALSVQLKRDLGFDRAQLGLAVSAHFLVSALASAPLGHYVERLGASVGMRLGAVASLLSLVGIATIANSWATLPLWLGVAGLANAFAQVASNSALAGAVASGRQGIAFGLKQAAVPASSLVAGLVLPTVGLALGWRAAFLSVGGVALAAALLSPRLSQSGSADARASPTRPKLSLLLLAVAGAFAGATGNSLAPFTVDASVTSGIGERQAGVLLSMGSGCSIVARVLSGHVVDRRGSGGYPELVALMAAGAGGFFVLALFGGSRTLFVMGILVAFAAAWGWPGLIYYVAVRNNAELPAAATGVVLTGVYLGTIVGPTLLGWVAGRASYSVAWAVAAVSLAIGIAAALVSRRLAEAAR